MWYVLSGEGGFLGHRWTIKQNTITSPRIAMVPSLDRSLLDNPALCHGSQEAKEGASLALAVLGIKVRPVAVEIVGSGEDSKIVRSKARVVSDDHLPEAPVRKPGVHPQQACDRCQGSGRAPSPAGLIRCSACGGDGAGKEPQKKKR